MNKEQQDKYKQLLQDKLDIESLFKFNSEYNRVQKNNGAIMYDANKLMALCNSKARKHNEKVRKEMPKKYGELMVQYRFIFA